MSDPSAYPAQLPPEQQAIRAKCFHPTGRFVEFQNEEIEQSIANRFEKIARQNAEHVAIKTRDQKITYSALNRMSNRIARAILARRGKKQEPIALLLPHGWEVAAAILGVLKAGKIFVPLDPADPVSRIALMLDDSQAELIVSDTQNSSTLTNALPSAVHEILNVDDLSGGESGTDDLGLPLSPETIAHIMYTSGSTGKPKAVIQNHRNVLHNAKVYTDNLHICSDDRLTLLHSFSNGAAMNNFFGALLNGAAAFSFDFKREGPIELVKYIVQEAITIYHSIPAVFRNFVHAITGSEDFSKLRLIRLSGAPASKKDVELYRKHFPAECILIHGMGGREVITAFFYFIDKKTELSHVVPVGYPADNMTVRLVDDEGKQVGYNEVGEIVIESRYLSPGYWRDPERTRAVFLPAEGDKRIYKTGDLGQMGSNGCMEYVGRKDSRIKIQGYRIEPAEIEMALTALEDISEAIVIENEDGGGEKRLVAYIVPKEKSQPNIRGLRLALREKLPDYMIPSAFVYLDALPISSNGKIDRQALPSPDNSRPNLDTPFLAPATALEDALAQIWADVLDLDRVGIHDNFFDLGGHSLLAMRVISHIRDDLQVELSLSNFFETPTVAALASCLQTARSSRDGAEMFSIRPASRDSDLLPSFAQHSLWFIDQLEPGSPAYNLFSATELRGPLNVLALEQSFNELIRCHESLRTVFKWVNGQPFQIIVPALTIALPVVDLRDITSPIEREAEIRRLSIAEARRPFDLERGPLLRAALLRLTEDTYVLFLTIHHIIFDGWSREVLVRELSTAYECFSSGRPALLPALPIQYADFAQWQRQSLQGKAFEEQLGYWKNQLKNLPMLQLSTDRPRPAVRTFKGARQSLTLPEDIFAGLKILGRQEGVTLFMTLLAVYLTLLHRYTGQNDIGIGSPTSGRNRSELERLIGLFLNMLVLRTDLSGNPTFRELLSRVRKVCLEAYANQEVPFERVVQELRPERSLSHNPLFQATFTLQNGPTCLLKLADVTAEDLDLGSGIARFDLHLFMIEHETTLTGWLVYNTDLFDASSIARLVSHFQILLEGIVANPDERICDLPILRASPTVAELPTVITEFDGKNLGEKDLDRILTELESLSDEEAKRLLADQSETATTKN